MKVLIVKTSSLGDLVHTFPALTDARRECSDIEFHWLVEDAFSQVPDWHPGVTKVLPIGLRRWRRGWKKAWRKGDIKAFRSRLREEQYDLIIDAQGLLKSALPARMAQGRLAGYDRHSAREPLASIFYHQRYSVSRAEHAIERLRHLFSQALDYPAPETPPDYGLAVRNQRRDNALIFLHSTTWASKHWPREYWAALTVRGGEAGFAVGFPWYEPEERLRAEQIIQAAGHGELLPRMDLNGLKQALSSAAGVVGVDTGLAHLAAALDTPAVTLYGSTAEGLTGAVGRFQKNLVAGFPCAPCLRRECNYAQASPVQPACFRALDADVVWQVLQQQMDSR
jgi:heptosyltransferase-1